MAKLWSKLDQKSNGHLISCLVFKWLHQDGGQKWSSIRMAGSS
jgi:hypothetical protein